MDWIINAMSAAQGGEDDKAIDAAVDAEAADAKVKEAENQMKAIDEVKQEAKMKNVLKKEEEKKAAEAQAVKQVVEKE